MRKLREFMNEGSEEDNKILTAIMDFFADNPKPPDDDVHDLAEKLGLEPDDFEAKIYAVLGSILGTGIPKTRQ